MIKQKQGIIGLASYYRKFIVNFRDIVRPLTEITKKSTPFNISPLCQVCFDKINIALTYSSILVFCIQMKLIFYSQMIQRIACLEYYSKRVTDINDKSVKSFLPITFISGTFVDSQKTGQP